MNTHAIPDTLAELMARDADLLPACVVSGTWPTVPVSSMTLDLFPTDAYVRGGTPVVLTFVAQPARTVTLSGADGLYWVALFKDTHSAVSGWTRTPGSHYLWRQHATQPLDPDHGLVLLSATVAGGVITAVTPIPALATRAAAWRTWLGLGTMATQNADLVNITGGTAGFSQMNATIVGAGTPAVPGNALTTSNAPSLLQGPVGLGATPVPGYALVTGSAYTHLQGLVSIGPTQAPNASYNLTVRNDLLVANGIGINKTAAVGYNLDLAGTMGMPGGAAAIVNTTSTRTIKTMIQAIPHALETILSLKGRLWEWRDPTPTSPHPAGFVMEEVAEAQPQWVVKDRHGTPGLCLAGLEGYVVEALRELTHRLEALEHRMAVQEHPYAPTVAPGRGVP